jgi:hypothetical protein
MVEDHTCSGDSADAKVYVNDTRVPVTDVDIHIRKEGSMSSTRYAEGKIVSPWQGVDYIDAFDTINGNSQEKYDRIRIDVKNFATDAYVTEFHGLVTGFGNGSGIEREWTFRAQGPGQLLDTIPISKNWSKNVSAQDVLTFISDALHAKLPLFVSVDGNLNTQTPNDALEFSEEYEDFGSSDDNSGGILNAVGNFGDSVVDGAASVASGAVDIVQDGAKGIASSNVPRSAKEESQPQAEIIKSFTPNRHTLADLVDWFQRKFNVRVWIVPLRNASTVVAIRYPHLYEHSAHYLGGNLIIENNDALSELRPINTLIAKGDAKSSIGSSFSFTANTEPAEYAFAKVRHKNLYKRSDSTEFGTKHVEVDAKDKQTVVNEAVKQLKQEIDSASGGDMQVLPRAPLAPYHLVRAKPTCDQSSASNTKPLIYEVHRAHHVLRAGKPSYTELDVGVQSNVLTDFEIVKTGWKTV